MAVLRGILFVAALAGLAAGAAMTLLQLGFTVPLILEAETFEAAAHVHAEEAWAPADGIERMAWTAVANIVGAVGFALLLVAASELAGGIRDWREGVFWGLAGFGVFVLAPGLGLPPELPGMPAAELAARQAWWIGCALATAAGLALIVFGRRGALVALGAGLLVLPHAVGAPQPEGHASAVPAELHRSFVVAATATGLVFWLLLGALAGLVRPRFAAGLGEPRRRLA